MDDEPVPVVYEEMIQNLEEKVRQYIRFQQHMKINFDQVNEQLQEIQQERDSFKELSQKSQVEIKNLQHKLQLSQSQEVLKKQVKAHVEKAVLKYEGEIKRIRSEKEAAKNKNTELEKEI